MGIKKIKQKQKKIYCKLLKCLVNGKRKKARKLQYKLVLSELDLKMSK